MKPSEEQKRKQAERASQKDLSKFMLSALSLEGKPLASATDRSSVIAGGEEGEDADGPSFLGHELLP